MRRGETVGLELNGQTYSIEYQGKRTALKWHRLAHEHQLANAKELHRLRQEYPADVVPDLHDGATRYTFGEVASLLEREKPDDPVAWLRDQQSAQSDEVRAPGATEREVDFMLAVLEPTLGEETAHQLLEDEGISLCFTLAMAVMRMHSLDAKAPRPAGLPVDEPAGPAPAPAGSGSAQHEPEGAVGPDRNGAL